MKHLPLILLAISLSPVTSSAEVTFQEKSNSALEVQIDGKVFAVFNHGGTWGKPFLFPVHAPNGKNVLREIVPTKDDQGSSKEGTDHFHHKGVWVSVDSVNDEKLNFWHEGSKIVCAGMETSTSDDGSGTLVVQNSWMEGEQPLVTEKTKIVFHSSRLVTYDIELTAVDKDVTFYDTKEGFFAVRVAHTMREMEGGKTVNAEGLKGSDECWGKPSPWIDYYGEVDGKICGVTLMDHPGNFRKSRYHVRNYGLFGISPFGPKTYSKGEEPEAPVTVSPGKESLKLTYGLYVHDGDTESADVADVYQTFLKVTHR